MSKVKLARNFNPGAFPDRYDSRDRRYKEIAFGAPPVNWEGGFSVLERLNDEFLFKGLTIENQGSSSSCVGQAYSKYAEVLNIVETKGFIDLSAKSIYERIFLPQGGAYFRDGAEAVVKGIATEVSVPSYLISVENDKVISNPPTEEFMRNPSITNDIRKEMETYAAKEYRKVDRTNLDELANAIIDGWGLVIGLAGNNKAWKNKNLGKLDKVDWWHAVYVFAFGQDDRGRWIDFVNSWSISWGEKGIGRIYVDEWNMSQHASSCWVIIDKPNQNHMVKLVKTKDDSTVYVVNYQGDYFPITFESFAFDMFGKSWKDIQDRFGVEEVDSIPKSKIKYKIGGFQS